MLNISGTNEDILMKLSVDLPHDVFVKWWWVHGHSNICMVAMPTFLRKLPFLNTLWKPGLKTKNFWNFFFKFSYDARSFRDISKAFFYLHYQGSWKIFLGKCVGIENMAMPNFKYILVFKTKQFNTSNRPGLNNFF